MKSVFILILPVLLPLALMAQLADDFTDGDFTADPVWVGDHTYFKVNADYQLQLTSSGENTSCLATEISVTDSMEWNFWVKLAFSPSDNNMARVYLMSDNANLKGNLNGYFIRLGESGSDDAIELMKQNGNIVTTLIRGTPGLIAGSFAIRIRVVRSKAGVWKLFADPEGGNNYRNEGNAADNNYTSASYFGIQCKYTSSNSTKFFFDDFYAGPVILDLLPPDLLSVKLNGISSLFLKFSENLDPVSAVCPVNYQVTPGIGSADSVFLSNNDPSAVTLVFSDEFQPETPYSLDVSNVKDLAGNLMLPSAFPFAWHEVRAFDVLINEIMADPEPSVSLPDAEYLELFNRSALPVDLEGWSVTLGNTLKIIPSFILPPGGYVILADDAFSQVLSIFGPVLSFPSFTLLNSGTTVTLRDSAGHVIHSVSYSDAWYRSEYKKEGGWSLELIDSSNPCGEAANWMASADDSGGSPGQTNSVNGTNPDNRQPALERVGITDLSHLRICFSEAMDSTLLSDVNRYSLEPNLGTPLWARGIAPDYRQVDVELDAQLEPGIIYTITLTGSMTDCAGNPLLLSSSCRFALPVQAKSADLIINEVLFDPKPGCADFVELFNRSSSVIDLNELIIAEYDTVAGVVTTASAVSSESFLVFPGDYILLSADTAAVKRCYKSDNTSGFIEVERLPAMNNDAGSIALGLKSGAILDCLIYTSSMHYPLLLSTEGVSLERIRPDSPSDERTNWHSAAETVGFATPAYRNSQFGNPEVTRDEIGVSPAIFSPDNDGYFDFMDIAYNFETPGYNLTIRVYDASGHLMRKLVSNALCGTSGSFTWDGITDNQLKAPIGRYIVFAEVFDLKGNVRHFKNTAVLGGKLK